MEDKNMLIALGIIGFVLICVVICCLLSIFGFYEFYDKKDTKPLPPGNFSITKDFNSTTNTYQWLLTWAPSSAGTQPITYVYNITTTDNTPFLKGSVILPKLYLVNALNNTAYNVSLYAQNKFGVSPTVNKTVITAGPPIIKRNTISWNYGLNPNNVTIEGETDQEISAADTNLKIGTASYSNFCSTKYGKNPGFSCIFHPKYLAAGEEGVFDATVTNKYGDTALAPPYVINVPGIIPTAPSNVNLNL